MGIGFPQPSGSGAQTVNGIAPDGGGNVALGAADIPYTPTYATMATTNNTSATVGDQLLWAETNTGTMSWVWGEPTLERAFGQAGGVHAVDRAMVAMPPLGGAPIDLIPAQKMLVANPGSVTCLGAQRVLFRGDVAGDLLDGEVVSENVSLLNINAGGRDLRVTSPSGRSVYNNNTTLLGNGGGIIEDVSGACVLSGPAMAPSGPTSTGLVIDQNIGNFLVTGGICAAPAGGGYTGFDLVATATVVSQFFVDTTAIITQSSSDSLSRIDPSATVPTTPLPTSVSGIRFFGTSTQGPGSMLKSTGLGADAVELTSAVNLNGRRSNWIGDVIFNSAGAPPDARLDHVGQPNVPLILPYSNAGNGGTGATLRELTPTAAQERHSLILGTPNIVSVNAGGTYTGADGPYPATQASTTGAGTGAEFTVTLTGGVVSGIASVDKYGEGGYLVGDTITLLVVGPAETTAAVLDVDGVAWLLRNNGAANDLTGPVTWRADHERVGGAGSTVFGYMARRAGGVGPWVEVPGSRSVPQALATPTEARGSARLNTIGVGDEWTIFWVNDNGNSTATDFTIIEPFVEGQP